MIIIPQLLLGVIEGPIRHAPLSSLSRTVVQSPAFKADRPLGRLPDATRALWYARQAPV